MHQDEMRKKLQTLPYSLPCEVAWRLSLPYFYAEDVQNVLSRKNVPLLPGRLSIHHLDFSNARRESNIQRIEDEATPVCPPSLPVILGTSPSPSVKIIIPE